MGNEARRAQTFILINNYFVIKNENKLLSLEMTMTSPAFLPGWFRQIKDGD